MKKKIVIMLLLAFPAFISGYAQYRQVNLPEKANLPAYKDLTAENKGFWCAFEAEGGSSIMELKPNMQFVGLTVTGGYRISEYLRLGVGFGGRMYVNNADIRDTQSKFGIPIYVNARGNFVSAYDRDGVPFWSVNIGGVTKEGLYLNPTIGYSFGGIRNNFYIGLSYTLSNFKDCTKTRQTYSSLGLKIGYEL
ncbi:MAG: hypothetical protein E7099_10375 [Mediterranea massiliensis]|nr:hypothetical protein [Mediterranea massiliensis]